MLLSIVSLVGAFIANFLGPAISQKILNNNSLRRLKKSFKTASVFGTPVQGDTDYATNIQINANLYGKDDFLISDFVKR